MEVKTLKDLRLCCSCSEDCDFAAGVLRERAIELIEELRKVPYARMFCLGCGKIIPKDKGQYCNIHSTDCVLAQQTGDTQAVIGYLIWYHNLTDEDFK